MVAARCPANGIFRIVAMLIAIPVYASDHTRMLGTGLDEEFVNWLFEDQVALEGALYQPLHPAAVINRWDSGPKDHIDQVVSFGDIGDFATGFREVDGHLRFRNLADLLQIYWNPQWSTLGGMPPKAIDMVHLVGSSLGRKTALNSMSASVTYTTTKEERVPDLFRPLIEDMASASSARNDAPVYEGAITPWGLSNIRRPSSGPAGLTTHLTVMQQKEIHQEFGPPLEETRTAVLPCPMGHESVYLRHYRATGAWLGGGAMYSLKSKGKIPTESAASKAFSHHLEQFRK